MRKKHLLAAVPPVITRHLRLARKLHIHRDNLVRHVPTKKREKKQEAGKIYALEVEGLVRALLENTEHM